MKRSKGDIRVIGMVGGTHVIEDIHRDVPYRTLVIIPEEQALMSKDLWRAISQGFLLQLASAPYPSGAPMPAPDNEKVRLEKYCAELEGRLLHLQNENDALRRQMASSANNLASEHAAAKLDEILLAIQAGIKVVAGPAQTSREVHGNLGPKPSAEDVIDGSAPAFLPDVMVPKDLDTRINIQGEASNSDSVSGAAERLRLLRKKGPAA